MRVLKKTLTLGDIIFSRIMYSVSFLIPRDKNLWIFIGWHGDSKKEIFADNSKYLFLHASQNIPDVRAVWIAKNKELASLLRRNGYTSYTQNSLSGIWHSLRAGYTFLDAFIQGATFRYSGGTTLTQLLHGRSLKKHGYGKKQLKNFDFIFGPSKFSVGLLPDFFKQSAEVIISGYPRCDVFFEKIKGAEIGISEATLNKLGSVKNAGGKAFIYMPTYRRGEEGFDVEKRLGTKQLAGYLEETNIHIFIKLHPKFISKKYHTNCQNLHFIEESDIYPLLTRFDALITDYSSIFGDFLLLNKPIILYPYDLTLYEQKEGFILDYETYMPGPRAYTPDELINRLEEFLSNPRAYSQKFGKIKNLYHEHTNGGASGRIVEKLLNTK